MNASAAKNVKDQVSAEEWAMRVDLAACYRLIALHGWDDLIFTHVSARLPGPDEHFLINAYGLLFEEMTASSLVKVDLAGQKVDDSPHMVNPAGFVIHSAVHMALPEIACVMHTHTPAGTGVATQKQGILPLTQHALTNMEVVRSFLAVQMTTSTLSDAAVRVHIDSQS